MNRLVNKDKFIAYLNRHPAAIKKLINPTEDFLVDCVKHFYRIMEFLPKEQQTKMVIKTYLETCSYGYSAEQYINDNRDVAAELSSELVDKFLEKNTQTIKYFPRATKEQWLLASKNHLNVDFNEIPKEVLCEKLLVSIIINGYSKDGFIEQIPLEWFTESFIKAILRRVSAYINALPKEVMTKAWVMYALGVADCELKIPNELWDEELALYAADKTFLTCIPIHLRSKDVCLKSMYSNRVDVGAIPKRLLNDTDIKIAFVGKYCLNKVDEYVPDVKEESFQLKALHHFLNRLATAAPEDKNRMELTNLVERISPWVKDWIPVLKLWPEAIAVIEKPRQTTEQIMTALSSRTEEDDLEKIAKSLNLAKVTKEIAPMLLNVEFPAVKDFVYRKFAPPKRADEASKNEVVVDISPQEFTEINR